jgi:anti-sigma B factor antagonist
MVGAGGAGYRSAMTSATAHQLPPDCEPFRVEVHPERDTVRVAPVGELDLLSVEQLDQRLTELYDTGFRKLVVDLHQLTFLDSRGLALIIRWDEYARHNGLELSLIQGPRAVQRLFEITDTIDRLPFR